MFSRLSNIAALAAYVGSRNDMDTRVALSHHRVVWDEDAVDSELHKGVPVESGLHAPLPPSIIKSFAVETSSALVSCS